MKTFFEKMKVATAKPNEDVETLEDKNNPSQATPPAAAATADAAEEPDDDACNEDDEVPALSTLMAKLRGPKYAEPKRDPLLCSFDLVGVADALQRAENVVVMCGAGISVSAGIPDFRTPGTGLYDNLQKYDLPDPQSIFELNYFKEHPHAFYQLAKEMWPGGYSPTPTHHFLSLLHAKV
eukprot:CAMPEP_0185795894 /NCGR_PEP_ID=MMETSP1174-20130828/160789_1 /TAXON_ID=35687 /ORGANISM="Dictyocha speculum, Strain CCMP1381" /LENGTH=179 /DNA_ID=CAMNT_0028491219 /DNA_START=128 /DNA_END=667 /DNA_ORIENTATION=-